MEFKTLVNSFLQESGLLNQIEEVSLFIFRNDGILLYSREISPEVSDHKKADLSSMAVLMNGAWQASAALISFLPSNDSIKTNYQDFRFSFDTSDTGFYLLPMSLKNQGQLFLGATFSHRLNPGKEKSKLRGLVVELEKLLDEHYAEALVSNVAKPNNDFLFENISDQEIEQLFEGASV